MTVPHGTPRASTIEQAAYRDLAFAMELDLQEGLTGHSAGVLLGTIKERCAGSDDFFLDVVDYALSHPLWLEASPDKLEMILQKAGSVWTVTTEGDLGRLEERVGPELRRQVDDAITSGRSGEHLGQAWGKAFGRDPDPTGSYRETVRAIEAATIGIVQPGVAAATLGTVIAALRDHPDQFQFVVNARDGAGIDRFRALLELVWKGQLDRHGSPSDEVPISVSVAEAQAAVTLGVSIVWLVNAGALTRR